MPGLRCPVRDCHKPIAWEEKTLRCAAGHAFDRARSGYCNLLQPQDKRSSQPGDSREAVAARRRSLDRGVGDALRNTLAEELRACALPSGAAILDAGCGEGYFVASLAQTLHLEAWGADLSVPALEAAAKRYDGVRWIAANADRRLPFDDGEFQVVMSITAAKNPLEFRRMLCNDGRLLVVVPGADDQAELREAVLGEAWETGRAARSVEMFSGHFQVEKSVVSRAKIALDKAGLLDLFAGAYRGMRTRQRAKLDALEGLVVTVSYEVLVFRPKVSVFGGEVAAG